MRTAVAIFGACVALALPAAATAARADDDEVRARGACSGGRTAELRVREDDGALRVELRIDSRRRGERWAVVVLHERRIAVRTRATTGSGGSFRVRRVVPDLFGTDSIVARATGPGGAWCRASARL